MSDSELLEAVDRMTFDHGETEIWARQKSVRKMGSPKKKATLPRDLILKII